LVLAGSAQAITVAEVIGLTRAEANDAVIMAKIEADGTVFRLTVDEILELKEAGVSDTVITFMINTGKVDLGSDVVEEVPEEAAEEEALEEDISVRAPGMPRVIKTLIGCEPAFLISAAATGHTVSIPLAKA
jgi:hypothetical protein